MSDPSPAEDRRSGGEARVFRWPALIHHSQDALFLLNQHRRLLTVNPRWEELTGVSVGEVRGLVCKRRAETGQLDVLASALAPPPEVFEGRSVRVRRQVVGLKREVLWWDVDFLPLQDGKGRLRLLGKLTPVQIDTPARAIPLPEKLASLRDRLEQHYGPETLASELLAMRRVADQVRLAGQSRAAVLIVGEARTGKQWLARIIHHQGSTRERGFAALDCAHLPPAVLEEALFGPAGLVHQTSLGTLYLREASHLPRELQARLYDWVEGVAPGGVRVLAGCRANPAEEVRAGRFLDRLHATLSTLTIELPPLRERRGDLRPLASRMLARLNARGSKRVNDLTAAAWEVLESYDWPGNLGELDTVLAAAWRRCEGPLIDVSHLPRALRLRLAAAAAAGEPPQRVLPLNPLLEEVERRLLELALRKARSNKSAAATLLDLWRPHLLRRVAKLGIEPLPPLTPLLEEVERRLLVLALEQANGNKAQTAALLDVWRPLLVRRLAKLGIEPQGS